MNSKSTNSKFNPIVNGLKVDGGFFSAILKVIESSREQLYLLLIQIFLILKKLASSRRVLRQYLSFFVLCTLGATIQLSLVFVFVEYSHVQYTTSLILAMCIASLSIFLIKNNLWRKYLEIILKF
ncbi:MAG: hypothetical protein WBL46_06595 [Nitrososphaeraceae archaeon]